MLFSAVLAMYMWTSHSFAYYVVCILTGWEFGVLSWNHLFYHPRAIIALGIYAFSGIYALNTALYRNINETVIIILLVAMSDVVQYFCGQLAGTTRLDCGPSPNKTIEGYLGAVLFTLLSGLIITIESLGINIGFFRVAWLITGGIFGDLYVSAVKRSIGIKDTGSMLKSHGGWFDRVDSIFGAMILYMW